MHLRLTSSSVLLLFLGCGGGGAGSGADASLEADAGAEADAGGADAAALATCLPAKLGPLELEDSSLGVRVHQSCDRESERVIVLDGQEPSVSLAGLRDLKESVSEEVFAIEGVVGMGLGHCCREEGEESFCLSITLQSHTLTIEELAGELTEVIGDGDGCLGVRVDVVGFDAPRCDPEDPECEPFPMCDETDDLCCPESASYDPDAPRTPVGDDYASLSGGACENDGECVPLGCGQYCMSYDTPGFVSTCECYPALSAAQCGCVAGQCQWFEQ